MYILDFAQQLCTEMDVSVSVDILCVFECVYVLYCTYIYIYFFFVFSSMVKASGSAVHPSSVSPLAMS